MAAANIDTVEIATQAAEAAAGIASILSSFAIIELARDYYNLYRDQREFYYTTFQQGVESPLAQEIYGEPIPQINYAGRVATAYAADTGPFGGESTDVEGWWERHRQAYGMERDTRLGLELPLDTLRVKSDWTNYLFRFEENQYDLDQDIRWRKRIAVHNIGIKQGSQAVSSLARSLSEYQENIADFGSQMATYGNGIAKCVGYRKGLADTADDFEMAGYR